MNDSLGDSAGAAPQERFFESPVHGWEVIFLGLFAVAILAAVWIQSHKEFLGNDELITAILASNPSFSEMWSTIRRGGELNPPLYFIMEWVMVRLFGSGDLALRAVSGVAVTLAGWVLYFTVRPLTGPRVAAVAIALVLGLSRDVFMFMSMARYYGFLFLLVALGAFLVVRLSADRPVTRRDYVLIFLVHCALVYVHLYGCFYSGMLFAAMVAVDWLRGKLRWGIYFSWIAAWTTFLAWLPTTLQQIKSVAVGVWTPPGYYTLGFFIEELGLQTPLALIVLLIVVLGGLALISSRPCRAGDEAGGISAPLGWAALALVAVALMCVPIGTWAISQVKQPPLYMRRYIFPCTAAWVLMVGLVLLAVYRLRAAGHPFKAKFPPHFSNLAWGGVLMGCLIFQPLRARKNPALPASPFTDEDYGYKNLPIAFENSWYFVPRAHYGQGRKYVLLIDRNAAETDPGWYTKCTYRFFQGWYPRYHKTNIALEEDLPETFLAVDDDYTKTFEWLFEHRPGLTRELLGTRKLEVELHGEERVWLVHNAGGKRK